MGRAWAGGNGRAALGACGCARGGRGRKVTLRPGSPPATKKRGEGRGRKRIDGDGQVGRATRTAPRPATASARPPRAHVRRSDLSCSVCAMCALWRADVWTGASSVTTGQSRTSHRCTCFKGLYSRDRSPLRSVCQGRWARERVVVRVCARERADEWIARRGDVELL